MVGTGRHGISDWRLFAIWRRYRLYHYFAISGRSSSRGPDANFVVARAGGPRRDYTSTVFLVRMTGYFNIEASQGAGLSEKSSRGVAKMSYISHISPQPLSLH